MSPLVDAIFYALTMALAGAAAILTYRMRSLSQRVMAENARHHEEALKCEVFLFRCKWADLVYDLVKAEDPNLERVSDEYRAIVLKAFEEVATCELPEHAHGKLFELRAEATKLVTKARGGLH